MMASALIYKRLICFIQALDKVWLYQSVDFKMYRKIFQN